MKSIPCLVNTKRTRRSLGSASTSTKLALPSLIQNSETLVSTLHNFRLDDEDGDDLGGVLGASILPDGMMASGQFHEGLPDLVNLGRVPVHATQEAALGHCRDNGSPGVAMRRRPGIGAQGNLEANDGHARGVLKLVVV